MCGHLRPAVAVALFTYFRFRTNLLLPLSRLLSVVVVWLSSLDTEFQISCRSFSELNERNWTKFGKHALHFCFRVFKDKLLQFETTAMQRRRGRKLR